jgi:hypothetical protein
MQSGTNDARKPVALEPSNSKAGTSAEPLPPDVQPDSEAAERMYLNAIAQAELEESDRIEPRNRNRIDFGSGTSSRTPPSFQDFFLDSRGGSSVEFVADEGGSLEVELNKAPVEESATDPKVQPKSLSDTRVEQFPTFGNDDASAERIDGLDVTQDAIAFARVATSKSVTPPLAVGVLGPWGSGKSFFMELVRKEVQRISSPPGNVAAAQTQASNQFHQGVIQIRFNAWHYAEANLWASLVGHIFQELSNATTPTVRDEVLGRLSTARTLTIDAATSLVQALREHAAASESLEDAKIRYAAIQTSDTGSGRLLIRVLKDVFLSASDDVDVRAAFEQLNKAAEELGVGEAITAQHELTGAGLELMRDGVEGRQILKSIANGLGSVPRALLLLSVVVTVPAITVSAGDFLLAQLSWISEHVRNTTTAIVAAAGALSAGVAVIARPVTAGLKHLKRAHALVQKHIDARRLEYEKVAADHQANVTKASAAVQTASATLKAASERLAGVREELHGQSPAGRLINFVRARASNGDYAKHLGIISTIRKDFEQLSRLLSDNPSISAAEDSEEQQQFRLQVDTLVESAKYERRQAASDGSDVAASPDADLKDENAREVKTEQLLSTADINELLSLAQPIKQMAMPFSRIVLYIDDVDRCPPSKVVEVLQAVHMLLAFRLFVVFVAVDVRWVGSSLAHQYSGMLKNFGDDGELTSASDYLEKIIQIPYWIPSMSNNTSVTLLDSLLSTKYASLQSGLHGPRSDVQSGIREYESAAASSAQGMVLAPTQLDSDEAELLRKFSVVIDSPRKMNRFVNVALFLKARGLLATGPTARLKNSCLFAQVALATADADSYASFKEILHKASTQQVASLEVLHDLLRTQDFALAHRRASKILDVFASEDLLAQSVDVLLRDDAWPARLSFCTPVAHVPRTES